MDQKYNSHFFEIENFFRVSSLASLVNIPSYPLRHPQICTSVLPLFTRGLFLIISELDFT